MYGIFRTITMPTPNISAKVISEYAHSAEHSGKPATSNDGVCLSLLVSVRIPLEDVCLIDKYSWLPLDKRLGDELLSRMGKNLTVPLTVIR